MKITFSIADPEDAPALVVLHSAVSEDLTHRFGAGFWSSSPSERGVLFGMRHARVVVAKQGKRIVGSLRLQTKKPWAIDVSYFTPVKKAIYLTGMAVLPTKQRKGIGRALLEEAASQVRTWPANVIRLDAFDAAAGAGAFYARSGFTERGRVVYRNNPLIYFERIV
jgi:GNAT superfamily N-acetyltransferase